MCRTSDTLHGPSHKAAIEQPIRMPARQCRRGRRSFEALSAALLLEQLDSGWVESGGKRQASTSVETHRYAAIDCPLDCLQQSAPRRPCPLLSHGAKAFIESAPDLHLYISKSVGVELLNRVSRGAGAIGPRPQRSEGDPKPDSAIMSQLALPRKLQHTPSPIR